MDRWVRDRDGASGPDNHCLVADEERRRTGEEADRYGIRFATGLKQLTGKGGSNIPTVYVCSSNSGPLIVTVKVNGLN